MLCYALPQVPRLRAERKSLQVDPRFTHVVNLVRSGYFGWEDYFGPIMDAITTGGDYYLVANDFPSYLEAQVCDTMTPGAHQLMSTPLSCSSVTSSGAKHA